MTKLGWRAATPMLLLLLCVASPAGAQDGQAFGEAIGQVSAGRGTVSVLRDGAESPLAEGDFVYEDDKIRTGDGESGVRIVLADRSELIIGAGSEVVLDSFSAGAGGQRLDALVDLVLGILRATVEGASREAPFAVRTRAAVASARATDWIVEAKENDAAVFVVEGRVGVASTGPPHGVVLTAGFGTDIGLDRAPNRPKRWGEARVQDVLRRTQVP